jgi:hypothetical protein
MKKSLENTVFREFYNRTHCLEFVGSARILKKIRCCVSRSKIPCFLILTSGTGVGKNPYQGSDEHAGSDLRELGNNFLGSNTYRTVNS